LHRDVNWIRQANAGICKKPVEAGTNMAGETPRAAARTDSGRIKVADWLKTMENRTAKSADPDSALANYSSDGYGRNWASTN
jgi:hypothetical protein